MNKFLLILGFSFLLASCSEEEIITYPCLGGDCDNEFWIDTNVNPGSYLDEDGYWHVPHSGVNYLTIEGQLSILSNDYLINGIPQLETVYDSNYWVWIDSITFTIPLYSLLGYFVNGDWNNPIPIGNLTYTLTEMANNHPPLNIVGYSINSNQCFDCPYSETLLGTYSKYNYNPRQQIFFDNEMVGDTAKVFIQTRYPEDIIIEKQINLIFE